MRSSLVLALAIFRCSTERVAFEQTSFSRTGFCLLRQETRDGIYRDTDALPIVGQRLVVDGLDAVRVTFQSADEAAADCYVILNTITDRTREHLDEFRMGAGADDGNAHALVCALPADVIISYQQVIVDTSDVRVSAVTEMCQWLQFVDGARPDAANPLTLVNGRGQQASLFVGPNARVVWPSRDLSDAQMWAVREVEIGEAITARLGMAGGRRVVTYDGESVPTCTLILFDGEMWRANGVGWLTRRYPGLRVVTIDAGACAQREAELTDADRVAALLQAVCDEAGAGPVMVAGQSYGGLAALEVGLRQDLPVDVIVAQSPSLWWGGAARGVGEGALMRDLRSGVATPHPGVTLRLQVGTLEQTMRPVVDDCAELLRSLGAHVELDHYRSGHDVAWWREGLICALDEWRALTY